MGIRASSRTGARTKGFHRVYLLRIFIRLDGWIDELGRFLGTASNTRHISANVLGSLLFHFRYLGLFSSFICS